MRLLKTSLLWAASLAVLGGLLLGLFRIHTLVRAERDETDEKRAEPRTPGKNGIVSLEDDEVKRYGLETEPARPLKWYEQATVYGRIVPNPKATVEIRSPFAGTLRGVGDSAWPTLGQKVRAGQMLGRVEVRVGPEVRLDLQNKLADARIKQRGAEEEVKLHQDRVRSLKSVTSQEIIARTELDAALVQLAQARTQAAAASASVELWKKALHEVERHQGADDSPWNQPLRAPADGEVTQVPARPGMALEAGAVVLQLVDFRRPLVRLDIPPELIARGEPPPRVTVQVAALSSSASPPAAEAHRLGPAPRVDAISQFASYWYELHLPSPAEDGASRPLWRPGMQVTARMRASASEAQAAVAVPASAILYHEGRPLVYVRIGPEKFQRREVRLLGRDADRCIVAERQGDLPAGIAAAEKVVSREAQVLLSREFIAGTADDD